MAEMREMGAKETEMRQGDDAVRSGLLTWQQNQDEIAGESQGVARGRQRIHSDLAVA